VRFIDTNIFLRFLQAPTDEITVAWNADCTALFRRLELGEDTVTTAEFVVTEAFWVLTSRRHTGLSRSDAASRLKTIVQYRGLRMASKRRVVRSLDLVISDPKLSLVDALIASTVLEEDWTLLSYDTDFDRVSGLDRQQPEPAS